MANLLTIKATLQGLTPPIWRRVAVPDTLTFWEFHFVLQVLFDWENSHLFEFRAGRGTPNDFLTGTPPVMPGDEDNMPEWQQDPRRVTLAEVLSAPQDKLTYVYDFGDNWEHQLVVEAVTPLASNAPVPPAQCLAGRRASPPEDIGGTWGYAALLEVLAEKAAGKRKRMPGEYAGMGKFDPEECDLPDYNYHLAHLTEMVAEVDAYLAQLQQQQAVRRPALADFPGPDFDVDAFLKSITGVPPAAPKKPRK